MDFTERVDIIGNQKFLDFVDDLEKLEDLQLDTFEVGKDKLRSSRSCRLEDRKEYDIGLPLLSPDAGAQEDVWRTRSPGLNVMSFQTILLPLTADDPRNQDVPV